MLSWVLSFSSARAVPVVEWDTVGISYAVNNLTEVYFTLGTASAYFTGVGTQEIDGWWTVLYGYGGTVGISHKWFEVEYGDLVDWDLSESADPFAGIDPPVGGSIHLNYGETAYLGYRLGGTTSFPDAEYGWVELYFDGNEVSVVSSAIERTGLGIYAGMGVAVPEPAAMGLLGAGVLALIWRKRKS